MNLYYIYVTSKGSLQVTKRKTDDGGVGTLKQGHGGAIYGEVRAWNLLEAVKILCEHFPHLEGVQP